jgi:glycerol-3-phosphate cytidylyltransferase
MEDYHKNTYYMNVGFTCSCFDLFHAGHVLMLQEARAQVDYLIVGLQTDPTIDRKEKNKPIQSVFERFVQLKGCKYVDEIVIYETEHDLLNILKSYRIDMRFVGEEYRDKDFTGKDIPGIEIVYNSRKHDFSTTELRKRISNCNAIDSLFKP